MGDPKVVSSSLTARTIFKFFWSSLCFWDGRWLYLTCIVPEHTLVGGVINACPVCCAALSNLPCTMSTQCVPFTARWPLVSYVTVAGNTMLSMLTVADNPMQEPCIVPRATACPFAAGWYFYGDGCRQHSACLSIPKLHLF